jgi:hypothetical protein
MGVRMSSKDEAHLVMIGGCELFCNGCDGDGADEHLSRCMPKWLREYGCGQGI